MRGVSIIGVGQTQVGEHWDVSLRELGADAIQSALLDAATTSIDAVFVGNAYGASINKQSAIASLIADYAGLTGVEAISVEMGDASGGAALRAGYFAVASGIIDTAIVLGVEKMTDTVAEERVSARNVSLDADFESVHGATLPALAAMLMRRYMFEYDVSLSDFEGFSVNAHQNGAANPNAMFQNVLRPGAFLKAPMLATPVNLFDSAPDADGAAAVVLTTAKLAVDRVPHPIHIIGSGVATDTFTLQNRDDMLHFAAVANSTEKALKQSNVTLDDIDIFEAHDAFTIMSVLSLEAAGFIARGKGTQLGIAYGKNISVKGKLPMSTFGGLKSRGNPAGASGIYQAVEATLQLRGQAKDMQVDNANIAMIQNLSGIASSAFTHILRA